MLIRPIQRRLSLEISRNDSKSLQLQGVEPTESAKSPNLYSSEGEDVANDSTSPANKGEDVANDSTSPANEEQSLLTTDDDVFPSCLL
ncbi:hypothetical protein NPIL_270991 [Nephila pilipes]|uniref:Uncharacterized protein n=1 Tax=Nephila pilipes TaxID=299642 RepID=A0A8X6IIN1_NEPPI|nr:hypothetical protein NPIL_270991 [Nephila pilipes]